MDELKEMEVINFQNHIGVEKSIPFPTLMDENNEKIILQREKRQKQEEFRKTLDEQIKQKRLSQDMLQKPLVGSSLENKSNPFFNSSASNNNIQRYQDILDQFCDIKLKVLNDQNTMANNLMIQKYQNMFNSMIDDKMNKLLQEKQMIKESIDNNSLAQDPQPQKNTVEVNTQTEPNTKPAKKQSVKTAKPKKAVKNSVEVSQKKK